MPFCYVISVVSPGRIYRNGISLTAFAAIGAGSTFDAADPYYHRKESYG
jgi:hypothetical protein